MKLVQLTCSAFDRKTHAPEEITTPELLRVYEDGHPQKIIDVRRSADLPLTLGILLDVSGSFGTESHGRGHASAACGNLTLVGRYFRIRETHESMDATLKIHGF